MEPKFRLPLVAGCSIAQPDLRARFIRSPVAEEEDSRPPPGVQVLGLARSPLDSAVILWLQIKDPCVQSRSGTAVASPGIRASFFSIPGGVSPLLLSVSAAKQALTKEERSSG